MKIFLLFSILFFNINSLYSQDTLPTGYRGRVMCVGGHVKILTKNLIINNGKSKIWNESVLQHEMKHAEQYQRYSSCEEADSIWKSDINLALRNEVEATCAQLESLDKNGENIRDWYGYFIWHIMNRFSVTIKPVTMAFNDICPIK